MTWPRRRTRVDIKDKACIEECLVDCIYEGAEAVYPPDECVDCGACEPVCPAEAYLLRGRCARTVEPLHQINADFFAVSWIAGRCGQGWHD